MSYENLIAKVQACRLCERMCDSVRVLSWANGPIDAPLMFIGEAPGRLGADRTAIPFHGDKAGDNFERLLELSGLNRSDLFITNAVLCNPRDAGGNNAPPSPSEIDNCSRHLRAQIEIVNPAMVMTLGAVALEATRQIESHALTLKDSVRTSTRWLGRLLLPLYHPGARALIHRSFANQTADYYFVGETYRQLYVNRRRQARPIRGTDRDWATVAYLLQRSGPITAFRLHKLMYLVDVFALRSLGTRATNFFYLRQKEGPYCVELGSRWYQRFGDRVDISKTTGTLRFEWMPDSLFEEVPISGPDVHIAVVVDEVLSSTEGLTDAQLKTRAYLTEPMKRMLKAEKAGQAMLNKPLLANVA